MTLSIKIKKSEFLSGKKKLNSPYVQAYAVIKHSINLPLACISCKLDIILYLCSQIKVLKAKPQLHRLS